MRINELNETITLAQSEINDLKLSFLNQWLQDHNAKGVGDKVYDNQGLITRICMGMLNEFSITIQPIESTHNLGNGYGSELVITF